MTLAEMDARMGSGELALWKAKVQVDNFVTDAMQRRKVDRAGALDFARADHRAVVARRNKTRQ
ncbi:MAG: hypothetical protein KDD75_19430 [Caldilineaceae bacterium]|nr:hypothetical protein [Caldilineaceae bacterium]